MGKKQKMRGKNLRGKSCHKETTNLTVDFFQTLTAVCLKKTKKQRNFWIQTGFFFSSHQVWSHSFHSTSSVRHYEVVQKRKILILLQFWLILGCLWIQETHIGSFNKDYFVALLPFSETEAEVQIMTVRTVKNRWKTGKNWTKSSWKRKELQVFRGKIDKTSTKLTLL